MNASRFLWMAYVLVVIRCMCTMWNRIVMVVRKARLAFCKTNKE